MPSFLQARCYVCHRAEASVKWRTTERLYLCRRCWIDWTRSAGKTVQRFLSDPRAMW